MATLLLSIVKRSVVMELTSRFGSEERQLNY